MALSPGSGRKEECNPGKDLPEPGDWRAIAEASGAGTWAWDATTGHLELSPLLYRTICLDPKDNPVSMRDIQRILHPDDAAGAGARVRQALADQATLDSVFRIVRPSGEVRRVHVLGTGTYDGDGRPSGMAGICIDVTPYGAAEEPGGKGGQGFSAIFENTPCPATLAGPDGVFIHVNELWARLSGYSCPEAAGRTGASLGIVRDRRERERIARLLKRDGSVHDAEIRIFTKSGEERRVLYSASTVTLDGNPYVLSTWHDVTGRRQAEEALRRREERYRTVADFTQDWVFWFDPDGKILYQSPSVERILGRPVSGYGSYEELLRDTVHPDDLPERLAHFTEERTGDHSFEKVFRIVRPDGEVRWIHHICSPVKDAKGRFLGTRGSNRDITKRHETEEALRESEEKFRTIIETANEGIWIFDKDGRTTFVNDRMARMLGCTRKEMIGRSYRDFADPDLAEIPDREFSARKPRTRQTFEFPLKRNDGSTMWALINAQPVLDPDGNFARSLFMVSDVTAWKAAREELRESEEKYRKLFSEMNEGFALHEIVCNDTGSPADYRFLEVNPAFSRLTGLSREKVTGKLVSEILPGTGDLWIRRYGAVALTGKPDAFEGYWGPLERYYQVLAYAPAPRQFAVLLTDITDRKYRQDTIRLSHEILEISNRHETLPAVLTEYVRLLREYTGCDSAGIRLLDPEGNIPYQAYAGFSEEFIRKESPLSLYSDHCMCINVVKGETDPSRSFYTHGGSFYVDGMTRFLATVAKDDMGKTRDVCHTMGYEVVALVPVRSGEKILGLLHLADHREGAIRRENVAVLEKAAYTMGEAIQRIMATIALKKGRDDLGIQVQERTAALKEAVAYHRSLIEASLDPLVTIRPDGTISDVNAATVAATGFSSEDLVGTDFTDYFTEPAKAKAGYERVFREGLVRDYSLEIRHREGRSTPVLFNATVFHDASGAVAGVFAAARDISALKKAEEAISRAHEETQTERQRLYDVLETLPIYICILDKDHRMPFANRYFRETFGYSSGRRCYEFLFNRNEPCENCDTFTVVKTGAPHRWYWTGPNGRNYDVFDFPFPDIDGSFQILEMGIDITEQKNAEDAVRRAAAYNRSLIEASLDPLITIDPLGRISDVNTATAAITGFSREELIGTDFSDYFTEPAKAKAGYERVFREGSVKDYELWIRHRDGHVTPVLYNATVFHDESGKVTGAFAAARDITERKKAEDVQKRANEALERRVAERTAELAGMNRELRATNVALGNAHEELNRHIGELKKSEDLLKRNALDLSEALAEKEMLLSEVHHRVKNNLTAFISLLSLEGSYEESEAGKQLKKDLQNRARSMALIHETLYRTKKYSHVDMGMYLRTLLEQVTNSYSPSRDVHVIVNAGNVVLDLGRATPCGLIVNELVTNSFKYAFPPGFDCAAVRGEPCTIRIDLTVEDSMYRLVIGDNGIGLPRGINLKDAKSLGLKLVNFLARHQLRASVFTDTGSGTSIEFRFSTDPLVPG